MLLIHGFTLNWQSWRRVIDELPTGLAVLAPTLPGHWGGPQPSPPPGVGDFVDFLEQTLDSAGWADAHVVGNSLGGWLALELAARGRARSVTAIAPAGLWEPNSGAARSVEKKFHMFSRVAPAFRLAAHPVVPDAARRRVLRSFVHQPDLVPADLAASVIEAPAHCRCFGSVNAGAEISAVDALRRVEAPTSVLFCERDRVIPPARYGQPMVEAMPKIWSKTLADVGHVPMLEAPGMIANEIRGIVDSVSGRANRSA